MFLSPITLDPEQALLAYTGVVRAKEDLEKHATWLQTRGGKPLPGQEVAIAEIKAEVRVYHDLATYIFNTCIKVPS